jgi:methylenetetrahydrofolate reductase (NADPH)
MTLNNKLTEAWQAGRKVITAECRASGGADREAAAKLAETLPASLDAVVVADNSDEVRGCALATAAILAGLGRGVVLTMTTRDRNRVTLEGDAMGAASLGVGGVLCVSGDHQSLGVCPAAASAYDIDSIQLTQAIRRMVDQAVGFDGRPMSSAPKLLLGATVQPYLQPMELNLLRLRKKIASGAQFLLTQAVFDLVGFKRWLSAVTAAGLDKQVKIVASVLPLTSADQAGKMRAHGTYGPVSEAVVSRIAGASDAGAEGVAMCAESASELKGLSGLAGIHILCGGCEDLAGQVIQRAGLGRA